MIQNFKKMMYKDHRLDSNLKEELSRLKSRAEIIDYIISLKKIIEELSFDANDSCAECEYYCDIVSCKDRGTIE